MQKNVYTEGNRMIMQLLNQISTAIATLMLIVGISIIIYAVCEFLENRKGGDKK